MITVKLFGLLRLNSGVKEVQLEADSMKQIFDLLLVQSDKISKKELESCVIFINGTPGSKKSKLSDGDVITLMSPVAGG